LRLPRADGCEPARPLLLGKRFRRPSRRGDQGAQRADPQVAVIRTEHIVVPRTALVASLGPEPESAPRELWYLLHGQSMPAAPFVESARALNDGSRLLVAPEALSRHYIGDIVARDAPVGATWMTKAEREFEMHDYIGYLDRTHESVSARLAG